MFSKTPFVYPLCNCWRPAQSSNSVTGGGGGLRSDLTLGLGNSESSESYGASSRWHSTV